MTVTIYGFAPSTFVRTARMACLEKGVSHELKPLEFREESHMRLHPFARMPVMSCDDVVLFETLAITCFIDEVFEGPLLRPPAHTDRCRMLQWISAASDYLYGNLVAGALDDRDAFSNRETEIRRIVAPFDAALAEARYFAGNAISLADLFAAPIIDFALSCPGGADLLSPFDHLARWRSELMRRESFIATASEAA
ncbi:MAG: glutathione S-transferase family protein [Rhodomicrobium sp.]|nr:glutathione S-transferase family protein [Rhodomicrobium sp.]